MLVVDASALYEVLVGGIHAEEIRARLAPEPDLVAPHIIDGEVLGVIRRDWAAGRLDETGARQAVADLGDWPGERFGHRHLLDRTWELRHTVRSWDALYVALAEAFDAPLLTLDARLARVPSIRCPMLIVGSG